MIPVLPSPVTIAYFIWQSLILSLNEQHGQAKALSSSDPTRPTEEHIGQESVKDKPVILDTKVLSI